MFSESPWCPLHSRATNWQSLTESGLQVPQSSRRSGKHQWRQFSLPESQAGMGYSQHGIHWHQWILEQLYCVGTMWYPILTSSSLALTPLPGNGIGLHRWRLSSTSLSWPSSDTICKFKLSLVLLTDAPRVEFTCQISSQNLEKDAHQPEVSLVSEVLLQRDMKLNHGLLVTNILRILWFQNLKNIPVPNI